MGHSFTYEFQTLDGRQTIPLKPQGENIELTNDNKREFVRLLCQKKLIGEIEEQIKAFKKGFHLLIPEKALQYMSPADLEHLIAGDQTFDLAEWKDFMRYSKLSSKDELAVWLWEILESFSNEELGQFLYFVTGKSTER